MRVSMFTWGRHVYMFWIRLAISLAIVGVSPARSARAQVVSPETLWTIGNCNLDQRFDLADSVMMLGNLFAGGTNEPCIPLCDVTGDGKFNIADPISILAWLFNGLPLQASTPVREEVCDGIDNDCDGPYDEDCVEAGLVSVGLAWNPVSEDVRGQPEEPTFYRLYIGTRSHQYTDVRNIGRMTDFRVYGLTAGVRYYFALTAFDEAGNESGFSNEVVAIAEAASP